MEVDSPKGPEDSHRSDAELAADTQEPIQFDNEPSNADSRDENPDEIRNDAILLHGVDELNTRDIVKYMTAYYDRPFQIEWVNDSSLNIVYDDPEHAFQALVSITLPEEFEGAAPIAPEQLRRAKPHPDRADSQIEARFAFKKDQKTAGARARSRYYLQHGEPSRRQDLARFGTRRSAPMKYGMKNVLGGRRREAQVGDLFPDKSPKLPLEGDLMEDLLPQKVGGRKKRRSRNKKRELPDLFASKANDGAPSSGGEVTGSSYQPEPSQSAPSIYQNMDY